MSDARVVLCAMPKSGSSYLTRYLYNGLGFGHDAPPRPAGSFPDCYLTDDQVAEIRCRVRFVWQVHFFPTTVNLQQLHAGGIDRVVVHLRDPRQALVSWVHHAAALRVRTYGQTDEFYALPFAEQLAAALRTHFLVICRWAAGWLAVAQRQEPVRVLVTDFDDFVRDKVGLGGRIAAFCGGAFVPKEVPLGPDFRLGEREEWRRVLTPAQAAASWAAMCDCGIGDRWGLRE